MRAKMNRMPPAVITYLTVISIVVIIKTERIIRCGELID
jgi:hypothetical protein